MQPFSESDKVAYTTQISVQLSLEDPGMRRLFSNDALRCGNPLYVLLAAMLLLILVFTTPPVAAQTPGMSLVYAVGNVELSPPQSLTANRALPLSEDQLIGTAANGWAILEARHAECKDASGKSWPAAKKHWIVGPSSIFTVEAQRGSCEISSKRRLEQIFANLESCQGSCIRTVTVIDDEVPLLGNVATESLFRELLGASSIPKIRPRHVDAMGLGDVSPSGQKSLCQRYADSAVSQFVENSSKGCGLSGSGWSEDPKVHLQWCAESNNGQLKNLERRRDSRRRILQRCRPRAKSAECIEYAAAAAQLQDDNLWSNCGFEGRGWNSNFDVHYDWCTSGDNLGRLQQVLDERRTKIAGCR